MYLRPLALLRRLPSYRIFLNYSESLILSAAAVLAFFILLTIYRWKRKNGYLAASVVLLVPILYGLWQLGREISPRFSPRAVVLSPKLALKESPLPGASIQEELGEGVQVRLVKTQGDFALVKSASGKEGWVERTMIGEIP